MPEPAITHLGLHGTPMPDLAMEDFAMRPPITSIALLILLTLLATLAPPAPRVAEAGHGQSHLRWGLGSGCAA